MPSNATSSKSDKLFEDSLIKPNIDEGNKPKNTIKKAKGNRINFSLGVKSVRS